MVREERFTFLCNASERSAIATLAARLHRSQSDAVRFVVIEAAKQLAKNDDTAVDNSPTKYKQSDHKQR
jgi:hypothetical protein